jgi:hypothetical protein
MIATCDRLAMEKQKKIKVHSLTGRINDRLLRQAFQAVKRNRGAAGVDRVSIKMFAANLEDNLAALRRELKTGTFQPLPLRRSSNRSFIHTRTALSLGATAIRRSSGSWNSTAQGTEWCSMRTSRDSSTTSRIV